MIRVNADFAAQLGATNKLKSPILALEFYLFGLARVPVGRAALHWPRRDSLVKTGTMTTSETAATGIKGLLMISDYLFS